MQRVQRISHCPSAGSQRYAFQWKYVLGAQGLVLNVGSADDPVRLGEYAVHFDYDDYSALFAKRNHIFVQGDAHQMPFEANSYDTVVCGDVLEHAVDPLGMFLECCRVTRRYAVFTIFEEWRLPSPGQHIEFGASHRDGEAQRYGHATADEHLTALFPDVVLKDGISHRPHINQFTDRQIFNFVNHAINDVAWQDMRLHEYVRAEEAQYDNHMWCNWLICMEKLGVPIARQIRQELEAIPQTAAQGIQ